jgi:DNA-binding Lrp family transcriptional regulator
MNYQLDEIDKKILDFLVENTRMPFTEIAKQMDVSAGTILCLREWKLKQNYKTYYH